MPLLLSLVIAAGLAAQTGKDSMLSRLAGQWSGTGTVLNQPATIEKFCRQAAVLRNGKLYMFESLEEAKRMYDYAS